MLWSFSALENDCGEFFLSLLCWYRAISLIEVTLGTKLISVFKTNKNSCVVHDEIQVCTRNIPKESQIV